MLYAFKDEESGFSLKKGEIVKILDAESNKEWCGIEIHDKAGWIPITYVRMQNKEKQTEQKNRGSTSIASIPLNSAPKIIPTVKKLPLPPGRGPKRMTPAVKMTKSFIQELIENGGESKGNTEGLVVNRRKSKKLDPVKASFIYAAMAKVEQKASEEKIDEKIDEKVENKEEKLVQEKSEINV
jgi:uncharacterized protein YgiM (DUF1202 family)